MSNFKNLFVQRGYFYEEGFINASELERLRNSVSDLVIQKKGTLYLDRAGSLRRMENFTFLDSYIENINSRVILYLKESIGGDYLLFKDKVNFKPSKGEGFHAHYDGVFQFKKLDHKIYNRWYEYADAFVNVLIALDDFTEENGALEVASSHEGGFEALLQNTKMNGTPDLTEEVERGCDFEPLYIKKGGIAVFKNSCPHRSSANYSRSERGSLYFTYSLAAIGDLYDKYFQDKSQSLNPLKALSGKLV